MEIDEKKGYDIPEVSGMLISLFRLRKGRGIIPLKRNHKGGILGDGDPSTNHG
jgi:hypothetical protein